MKKRQIGKDIVIYQAKGGAIELRGDYDANTLWATQSQIADAFSVDVRTINEHIKNIYKTRELSEKATIRNFRIVQKEGKRNIERDIKHYSLDLVLSVGYRVNSKKATAFRQWATKTLRAHIVDGYTINKNRVATNYTAFMSAVADVRALLPAGSVVDNDSIIELVALFADTWLSLDAYDKGSFSSKRTTKKSVGLTAERLSHSIEVLKGELMRKKEATELFATERSRGAIEGIVGNVMQSFAGKSVYPGVEEKAAHLLYFMVKNHPFVDGNKRSGAYAFIWFLRSAKALDISRITPTTLTALTLLVAESNPKEKEKMVGLITMLLMRGK